MYMYRYCHVFSRGREDLGLMVLRVEVSQGFP